MGLEALLSPLVFSELYRSLDRAERLREHLEDRLSEIGLDHAWLAEAAGMYEAKWASDRGAFAATDDNHALSNEHALLASWLLAPLQYRELSADFDAQLKRVVTQRALAELDGDVTLLPSAFKPAVSSWQLGMVLGKLDPGLPLALAHLPRDKNVSAAYKGLVEHVLHLEKQNEPWPEILGTSTLWRGTGLAEGMRPDADDAQDAVKQLLVESRRTLPEHMADRLARHFSPITEQRNVLSHVADSPGKRKFHELTAVADDWTKVRMTVFGITHFVCSLAATELTTESAGSIHENSWQNAAYEIAVWD